MLRDSPFHTSSTLVQKVRESINNRQPPFRPCQHNNPHYPFKSYRPSMEARNSHDRHGTGIRPSLQHISSLQHIPLVGDLPKVQKIQSCQEMEGAPNEYYLSGCKSSKDLLGERELRGKEDRRFRDELGERREEKGEYREVQVEREKEKEDLFRLEDFEEQLNQFLKDQRNVREILSLIDRKDDLESQPPEVSFDGRLSQEEIPIVFQNQQQEGQREEFIDFDALREQELQDNASEYVDHNPLMASNNFLPHPQILRLEPLPRLSPTSRMTFLLDSGQLTLHRYYLSN